MSKSLSSEDLLQVFQDHTLKKHLKCFRDWQKFRSSDLTEMTNVLDHQHRRMRAFDLENYVQGMFPTERYIFSTVMHKDFLQEVAHKLSQDFEKADHQNKMELAFKLCLPQSLRLFPSVQEEVDDTRVERIREPHIVRAIGQPGSTVISHVRSPAGPTGKGSH